MLIPLHTDDGRFESPPSMAVILMTGANQGLGYEALKTLAKAKQHKLIVATRSQQKSKETIASIVRATGANRADFTPVVVDLTSDESIYAAAKTVESIFGFLAVLVNNAAHGAAFIYRYEVLPEIPRVYMCSPVAVRTSDTVYEQKSHSVLAKDCQSHKPLDNSVPCVEKSFWAETASKGYLLA